MKTIQCSNPDVLQCICHLNRIPSSTKTLHIYPLIWTSSPKISFDFEKPQNMYEPSRAAKKPRLFSQHEAVFFLLSCKEILPIRTHCGDESHRKPFHQMVLHITVTPVDTCRPQDLQLSLFILPRHWTKSLQTAVEIMVCNSYALANRHKLTQRRIWCGRKVAFITGIWTKCAFIRAELVRGL